MACSIGEIHKLHHQPRLKKYAYHKILLCLLGKYECKNLRRQYLLAENNSVTKESNYAKASNAEFDIEIQSD